MLAQSGRGRSRKSVLLNHHAEHGFGHATLGGLPDAKLQNLVRIPVQYFADEPEAERPVVLAQKPSQRAVPASTRSADRILHRLQQHRRSQSIYAFVCHEPSILWEGAVSNRASGSF